MPFPYRPGNFTDGCDILTKWVNTPLKSGRNTPPSWYSAEGIEKFACLFNRIQPHEK